MLRRSLTPLLAILTLAIAFGGATAVSLAVRLPQSDEFNVLDWELRHVPNKWLYVAGRPFRDALTSQEEDERIALFLELSREASRLATGGDANTAELQRARDERESIENDVEAIVEGRLTAVLNDAGLGSSMPLFPGARWVFPPVDVVFDAPPLELAVSPRTRIQLIEQRPLSPGMSLEEVEATEAGIESDGVSSALVSSLSGAATYPSIVAPTGDYQSLVETVAHEWVHQYLAFKPLGQRFYDSVQLRTLNETVATVAGEELGRLFVERYPLPAQPGGTGRALRALAVDAALRQLRKEVDGLLAAGQIEAAERHMEERRLDLAEQGVYFRKINQAFFAFRGVYATGPESVDPIGGQVVLLRAASGSVGAFLREASELTSPQDLELLLAPTPP